MIYRIDVSSEASEEADLARTSQKISLNLRPVGTPD